MIDDRKLPSPYPISLRAFHWGVICFVLSLAFTGYAIYFREILGIATLKRPLVYVHAFIAYGFLTLLLFRVWLNLKGGNLSLNALILRRVDIERIRKGDAFKAIRFAGRGPVSRFLSSLLIAGFCIMAATGLVRAGTDLYHLPLGPLVQNYVRSDTTPAHLIMPFEKSGTDPNKYNRVMGAKVLVGKVHIYTGFFILFIVLVHVLGNLIKELNGRDGKSRGLALHMLFGPSRARGSK